jgi:hypothetical protein
LTNLCRNAVQAMAADTDDPALVRRLTISAGTAGKRQPVIVADTGPGPAGPSARENLFAAFRGSARSGGTGLGLAIAHELVRAHGGMLELVESVGGRTVFALSVPDQPVRLTEDARALRARLTKATRQGVPPGTTRKISHRLRLHFRRGQSLGSRLIRGREAGRSALAVYTADMRARSSAG